MAQQSHSLYVAQDNLCDMGSTRAAFPAQRMIDDMAFHNISPNTQKVYAYAVANFARYHQQSPDKLGLEHIRDYRLHLMSRGLKASSP